MAMNTGTLREVDDAELHAQIEMLPSAEEVSEVVSQLKTADLREFAVSVMNASVESAHRGRIDIQTVRFLNGWFASMEETIAAGDDIEEILSRRRASGNYAPDSND